MENKRQDVDLIAFHINNAVQIGNSRAATAEAEEISKRFILIRREELPKVEYSQFTRNPTARTASYREGADSSRYRRRALDFIAIAGHAEQAEKIAEFNRITEKRKEAWKLLHPECNTMWDYTVLPDKDKAQIDMVVGLMNQVDELKEKQ